MRLPMNKKKANPTFLREKALQKAGFSRIIGIDEAGAGCLAGPLIAGAVILPTDSRLGALQDSKLLSEKVREALFEQIIEKADAFAIGMVSVEEITNLGLRPANLLAMRRAAEAIQGADYALVDAWTIPGLAMRQEGIIRGDQKVKSIAAASIIAKVTRDRLMKALAEEFPGYGFDIHKGYATKAHRDAIKLKGPCAAHRLTYKTFQS